MEGNDISKRTVLVLLVLTLVVSVVGTWTILSQPTTIYRTVEIGEPGAGEVRVHIGDLPEAEPIPPAVEGANVGINIRKG